MIAIELFLEASILVQLVMLSLIILSVYSWTLILNKKKDIMNRANEIKLIKTKFSENTSPDKLLSQWFKIGDEQGDFAKIISKSKVKISSMNRISASKVNEKFEFIKENMELMIDREIQSLKKNTVILATIGSVSPYIGLFGTVWGIMNSFIAIGEAGQATLEYVAPGIAEALIATAIGLFAAIPAYISYNVISNKIDEIEEEYDLLKDEFCLSSKEIISNKLSERG